MISASFLFGSVLMIRDKRERLQTLRGLRISTELAIAEMTLRGTALPDLLEILLRHTEGSVWKMFSELRDRLTDLDDEVFSFLWQNAAEKNCTALLPNELSALCNVGSILGRYDLETQTGELRARMLSLDQLIAGAAEAYPMQRRLYLGLGSFAAALTAILLR